MKLCILKSYLGSDRHLVVGPGEGRAEWTRAVPADAWALGVGPTNHALDIRAAAEYAGAAVDWEIPAKFTRADEEANVDVARPIQTMPRSALLAHVGELLSKAESLRDVCHDSYITGQFASTRQQLGEIRAARVDPNDWREAMEGDGGGPAAASFEPNSDGLADATVYDQLGSITGRLTVTSGPQILTLRRDLRGVLRPTRRGRRLLMVDFVSHEPRVTLCLMGGEPPLDIYGWFREERMSDISRDLAKSAVISTLYGMSPSTLAEKLDCTLVEAKLVNEVVRGTFGLVELEKRLLSQLKSEGHILSHFGRRIRPSSTAPGVVVNSFIQSTAYDVAMAGFREILSMLASSLIEASVFFYIHDAMVLEVSERDQDRLREILSSPVEIPGVPGRYWAKVKEVSE